MKYHRLKGRFSKKQVVQATGICRVMLDWLEADQEHLRNCRFYMALAKFYGVFVEELLAEYPENALSPGVYVHLQLILATVWKHGAGSTI